MPTIVGILTLVSRINFVHIIESICKQRVKFDMLANFLSYGAMLHECHPRNDGIKQNGLHEKV